MRQRGWPHRATMLPMTDDAHARANAEQLRLLREALAGADAAERPGGPAAAPAPSPPLPPAGVSEPLRSS